MVQTLLPKFFFAQISSYSELSNLFPKTFCKTINEHANPQSQSVFCFTWGNSICRRNIWEKNMSPSLPMCGLLVMSLTVCEIVLQRNTNKTYLSGRAGSAPASWSGLNVMFTYKHPNPQPYGRKYATKEKSRRKSRDSRTKVLSWCNGLITKNSLFSLSNDKQTKEEIGNETLSKNGYGDMGIPILLIKIIYPWAEAYSLNISFCL